MGEMCLSCKVKGQQPLVERRCIMITHWGQVTRSGCFQSDVTIQIKFFFIIKKTKMQFPFKIKRLPLCSMLKNNVFPCPQNKREHIVISRLKWTAKEVLGTAGKNKMFQLELVHCPQHIFPSDHSLSSLFIGLEAFCNYLVTVENWQVCKFCPTWQ